MNIGALIIGDEILSGKRVDQHFTQLTGILGKRGLRLCWAQYLGDDRARLTETLRRTFASGEVVFSFGGIGNTPDDHTRQAAAAALGLVLQLHPDAEREITAGITARLGRPPSSQQLSMGDFPPGSTIIPNPVNRIPGFALHEHYFLPGFPQMAWPMAEWVLDTYYADRFDQRPLVDRAFLLTGPNAYESALLDLMEQVVAAYPQLRLFSLPSIGENGQRRHLELGVEGAPELVDAALEEIRQEVERRGISWSWRS